jgi:hypothetical protein
MCCRLLSYKTGAKTAYDVLSVHTYDLDQDTLPTPAVELAVKDLLPGAKSPDGRL